ncbi:hypothetical protein [Streptomyces sp. NPDC050504]|uniref:hypothetical protein n=1 Tax=Streptomyces sp. NPDC050504 TaxID=3365618 RepID=UPI0037918609
MTIAKLAMLCGVVVTAGAVSDAFHAGYVEPYQAFGPLVMLQAAADLTRQRRPALAGLLRNAAAALVVVAGLTWGYQAWGALLRNGAYDWLGLIIGAATGAMCCVGGTRWLMTVTRRPEKPAEHS